MKFSNSTLNSIQKQRLKRAKKEKRHIYANKKHIEYPFTKALYLHPTTTLKKSEKISNILRSRGYDVMVPDQRLWTHARSLDVGESNPNPMIRMFGPARKKKLHAKKTKTIKRRLIVKKRKVKR
jgi:hypothetical protein